MRRMSLFVSPDFCIMECPLCYKTSGGAPCVCVCFYVCAHIDGAVVLSDTGS